MTEPTAHLRLTATEVDALRELLSQFLELLDSSAPSSDPALARLAPSGYTNDAEADREFRRLTEGDLMTRRRTDAEAVSTALGGDNVRLDLRLAEPEAEMWMRTLAAMRLVLAERLGIANEDNHRPMDPNFRVYDWLGYRLERLIDAFD